VTTLASIPSPTTAVWHLGWLPIRAYALCIILGILAACYTTERRMRRRGAPENAILDIAVWAVPFGIVGARVYHVITSPELYFDKGQDWVKIFYIWEGGLGIWGAVALGAVGAWLGCRRLGIPLTLFADALAPGLPIAQAIGRLGNWFNNELFGSHTDLPWGLTVYDYDLGTGKAITDANGDPVELAGGPFHPTFLYELVWDVGVAVLVYIVDKRWKLGKGRAFALYVMAYTVGRFWIEALRIDPAHGFGGLRLNNWVSIVVFLGALIYFLRVKGPQEFIKVDEDGTMHVVTADGAPIVWRSAPKSTVDSSAAPPPSAASDAAPSSSSSSSSEPEPESSSEPADAEKK
jgi:prolipoprotein diacylglyceryl transferase